MTIEDTALPAGFGDKGKARLISLEEGLYLASEDQLMARLRALADNVGTVLLIGHNDGIGQFAEMLAGRGSAALMTALREKYPTGTLTTLRAPIRQWPELAAGAAIHPVFSPPGMPALKLRIATSLSEP